jgi:hypothetical protein
MTAWIVSHSAFSHVSPVLRAVISRNSASAIPFRLQERLVAGHRKLAVLSQEPTLDAGRVQDRK